MQLLRALWLALQLLQSFPPQLTIFWPSLVPFFEGAMSVLISSAVSLNSLYRQLLLRSARRASIGD
jgi:hypothetical protein